MYRVKLQTERCLKGQPSKRLKWQNGHEQTRKNQTRSENPFINKKLYAKNACLEGFYKKVDPRKRKKINSLSEHNSRSKETNEANSALKRLINLDIIKSRNIPKNIHSICFFLSTIIW